MTASVEGIGYTQVLAATASGAYLAYITSTGAVAITDGTNTATTAGTITVGVPFKVAASWGPAGLAISLNQGTVATNASYSGAFNGATTVQLGQSGSGSNSLYGHAAIETLYGAQYTGSKLQGF